MENKKSLVALALVALVGVVGATFAYFTSSAKLTNEFKTGTYSTSVTEEFISPDNWTPGTTTTKKVNVTNNGSVEVAVRAKYTEKWTAADGTDLPLIRDSLTIAQFEVNSNWIEATDGYYYYDDTLVTGETSSDFISSVTFSPNFVLKEGTDIECTTTKENGKTTVNCTNLDSGYAGATYSMDITIETIQADQKWSYTPGHTYKIGEVVKIGSESFNVIKSDEDTVTMLAQYSLGSNYVQNPNATDTDYKMTFSNGSGWEYTPGPKEIDIQACDGNAKTYVNNYVTYLQGETGDTTLSGTLMTVADLKALGCTVNDDYTYDWATENGTLICNNSPQASWLINGQTWWLRSASANNGGCAWYLGRTGKLGYEWITVNAAGIRPVITVSKDALANL